MKGPFASLPHDLMGLAEWANATSEESARALAFAGVCPFCFGLLLYDVQSEKPRRGFCPDAACAFAFFDPTEEVAA